jgi:hypothetical protein
MTRAKNKSAAPWVCRVGLSRKFRRSATTCRIARPRWSIARQACRAGRPAHNCPRTINRRCDLPLTPPALSRPGSARRAGIAPPAIPPDNPAAWVAAPANQACAQDRREGPQLRRTQAGRSRSAQLSLESSAMRLQGSSRRSVLPSTTIAAGTPRVRWSCGRSAGPLFWSSNAPWCLPLTRADLDFQGRIPPASCVQRADIVQD